MGGWGVGPGGGHMCGGGGERVRVSCLVCTMTMDSQLAAARPDSAQPPVPRVIIIGSSIPCRITYLA